MACDVPFPPAVVRQDFTDASSVALGVIRQDIGHVRLYIAPFLPGIGVCLACARRTAHRVLSGSNSLLSILLSSDLRGPYLAVEDLERLEEVVVAPDELVADRQVYVFVVAALDEDPRSARITGPSGGQVALDQRPNRLPGGVLVPGLEVAVRDELAELEQRRGCDRRR